ncbi:4-hydroxybenzoate polyprenyltransferase [Helicobacter enhydrae]|uniref:4-hydroxybenzoate polyprenyltransferase n=1 Tax=Helicobacter enhydrae TaxID=222136 RepID=A0A1B1U7B1_9HELI|nr:menaquinone biosynthesis prenyltransferase MqnP [Helicobacter enhydrae]ANV98673.1 4-hydroxybenzoate polyprenyltransferase [Helicobacter enhydrae]
MLKKIKDFNELVAFEHTIFSVPFMLVALVCASLQKNQSMWMGADVLILCALALVFARNFAMAFNRYVDRDIDALNERTQGRPSVDGRVSEKQMLILIVCNAAGFILVSFFINQLAFLLSIPFLFILGTYSFMKRFSYLAHLMLGLSLGLAPTAGSIAILGDIPLWCIALSIGVLFWVAGFDLLYSLQDIKFDQKHRLHSIPAIFGEGKTLKISRVFHSLTILFWFIFMQEFGFGVVAYIALIVCALILLYEQWLVSRDFKNIPKAFFVTNGYLGFVFLCGVMLD